MEHEEDKRELKLINIKLARTEEGGNVDYLALEEGHTLRIPPNVWFIGTANRDESTFVISDKVYDRAQTMNFTKRAAKVRNSSDPIPQQYYDYKTMDHLLQEARQNGRFDAENNALIKSVEALMAPFNISFGNRILKQIEDFVNIYCACFADDDVENEAIEKILLSKVVAKLEVKTIDDKEKLVMEFEKLKLHQCVDFIKRLDGE
jgi:5-methylcytosine-specific restriction endonuclease McrBC GTP-binding regulatory subunit McrB